MHLHTCASELTMETNNDRLKKETVAIFDFKYRTELRAPETRAILIKHKKNILIYRKVCNFCGTCPTSLLVRNTSVIH